MITLKEIDRHNFKEIIELSVTDDQKDFVASNMRSLAQSKAQPECIPLAIYNGEDVPVGFIMYCLDFEDNEYWIYRLMIDKNYQGKGYGREALKCVLEEIAKDKKYDKVYISVVPGNEGVAKLYEEFGFKPDSRVLEGEIVYCLQK
ncbi:MAG: GNAT family N-acetyltransferase [Defluviitaleaceae bacterium]|nr:GNAT family N-acetyltransferase [Defluviitaleaceae bacterium]